MAREAAIVASQAEVAAMRADLEDMGSKVARGVAVADEGDLQAIKREPSPIAVPLSGEVIDISDDD